MTKAPALAPKPKRPKQVPITFAECEEHLLTTLDHNLKATIYSTRSAYFKQNIREDFL